MPCKNTCIMYIYYIYTHTYIGFLYAILAITTAINYLRS